MKYKLFFLTLIAISYIDIAFANIAHSETPPVNSERTAYVNIAHSTTPSNNSISTANTAHSEIPFNDYVSASHSNTAHSKTPFDNTVIDLTAIGTKLPVSLTHFGSKKIDDRSFQLFWEIPIDENFSHFEIEESFSNNEFQVIETISYIDNTNKYFSKTVALDSNIKFYRLKLINIDGAFEYSELIFVNRLPEDDITISPIASSYDFVNITVQNTEKMEIKIYAINGILLETYQLEGSTKYKVEVPKIGGDTMFFEIKKGDKITTKKLLRL